MENLVIDSPVCAVEAPFSQNTINSVIPNQPVSMLVATSTRLKIEQIAIEVSAWESGAYTESNMILYALIQKSYAMYLELTDTKDGNLKHRKQGLNDYLMLAGLGAYIDKPLTTKLIRALFGNRDRRRLSTYNTVLKFLIKNEFAVSDVPAKVAELGGVQEISLGRAEGYLTAKERAAKVREEVADASIASFTSASLKKKINADKVGERYAAVLTYEADGSFIVNCLLQSNTAVNATLTAYFNSKTKDKDNTANEAVVRDKQKQMSSAINAAIAS